MDARLQQPAPEAGLGRETLRVVFETTTPLAVLGVGDDDADQPPVLVVEDMPGSATSGAG